MYYLLILGLFISFTSCGQNATGTNNRNTPPTQDVGGPCEGCKVIYNSPVPFEQLNWIDTLPDYNEQGQKLIISGVIYDSKGKPAKDVVLYVYHTDQTGHYTNKYQEKEWAGRHGYIKGWIKTNNKGEYRLYTLRPKSYPQSTIPAHIHPVIKEPGKGEYYIDEFLFDDDPFLTAAERNKQEGRGGNGIMTLREKNGILYGERNIYLGRKIPGY
jgi:protocatechuate 3,4-dioxygenase beta subunit